MLVPVAPSDAVAFVRERHYTGTASAGMVRYGWEVDGVLVGVSIYDGGTRAMQAGVLGPTHARRVLHHHRLAISPEAPRFTASQFLAAAHRDLRTGGWAAVVTYADLCAGHVGTIYQATNALYTGLVSAGDLTFRAPDGTLRTTQGLDGPWPDRRAEAARRGWVEVRCLGKHRYVYLLERGLRPSLAWPVLPYPPTPYAVRRARRARAARDRRARARGAERLCAACGEAFAPRRTDARYCSGRCRVRAHRARRSEDVVDLAR
ncbi:hypothetical protein BN12_1510013 [Nostocoides japonicum T1-X7]|uniref:Uncharacterized protein n=1 Tax=Nostocoides japonicum T1-X7 TaxID=1194083 RepID=A0A077LY80_9MICO|nr:hypothetical protein [Tetrasphaera japonica]CCH76900.1 hypothetical protein BN12_1510013 [Tetrasphaera japonica T1-X7]